MSLFGQSYEEYTNLYASGSSPIVPSDKYSGIITVLLIIVAFISLSLALLVDKKAQSPVSYFTHATIASLAVGLGSIYVSNSVGVYI
ncbi:hypothetical protein QA089_002976 [Meyerozyma guilliermondii]